MSLSPCIRWTKLLQKNVIKLANLCNQVFFTFRWDWWKYWKQSNILVCNKDYYLFRATAEKIITQHAVRPTYFLICFFSTILSVVMHKFTRYKINSCFLTLLRVLIVLCWQVVNTLIVSDTFTHSPHTGWLFTLLFIMRRYLWRVSPNV